MLKLLITTAILLGTQAHAFRTPELSPRDKATLEREGFIAEDGGIKIVPGLFDTNKGRSFLLQQKNLGYTKEEMPYVRELLQMPETIQIEFEANADRIDEPLFTGMKHTPSQVGVLYNFKPVPTSDITKLIGFAASGSYDKESGWDGIGEFFVTNNIGTCVYTENNTKLSHATVKLAEEFITHDVNNKATEIFVKGTKNSGYLYTVKWYSADFFRTLECANMKYSSSTTALVIALANKIDNQ